MHFATVFFALRLTVVGTFFGCSVIVTTCSANAQRIDSRFAATVTVNVNHPFPMAGANTARTSLVDALPTVAVQKWKASLPRRIADCPVADHHGRIVVQTQDASVFQLNAMGQQQWNYIRHGRAAVTGPVISADGTRMIISFDWQQAHSTDARYFLTGIDSLGNTRFETLIGKVSGHRGDSQNGLQRKAPAMLVRNDGTVVLAIDRTVMVVSPDGIILQKTELFQDQVAELLQDTRSRVIMIDNHGNVYRWTGVVEPQLIGIFPDSIHGSSVVHPTGKLVTVLQGNVISTMDLATGSTQTLTQLREIGSPFVIGSRGDTYVVSTQGEVWSLSAFDLRRELNMSVSAGSQRAQSPLKLPLSVATNTYGGVLHHAWIRTDGHVDPNSSRSDPVVPLRDNTEHARSTGSAGHATGQRNPQRMEEPNTDKGKRYAKQHQIDSNTTGRTGTGGVQLLVDRSSTLAVVQHDGTIAMVEPNGKVHIVSDQGCESPVGIAGILAKHFVVACASGELFLYGVSTK